MVLDAYLKSMLEELRALGVKRVAFDPSNLSRPREVEFFEAAPTGGDTETVELPVDDGVPMGVRNAADLLMAKKPAKGAT